MGERYIRRIMVLGSVPSMGPVMLFDDIEDLFKWAKSGTGGDDTLEKDATKAYNGLACMHMKTRVTTATASDVIQATRSVFARPGKRYRVEALWYYTTKAANNSIFFEFVIEDGTKRHTISLRFIVNSTKWQYVNSAGSNADVPGGTQDLAPAMWHRVMVEFDQNAVKFIKMVSDGLEVDMSALAYSNPGSVVAQEAKVVVQAVAHTSPPAEIYVEDVLILEI